MIMLVMFHSPTDFNLNCVPQKLRDKAEKSTALSYFSYDGFEVFTEGCWTRNWSTYSSRSCLNVDNEILEWSKEL